MTSRGIPTLGELCDEYKVSKFKALGFLGSLCPMSGSKQQILVDWGQNMNWGNKRASPRIQLFIYFQSVGARLNPPKSNTRKTQVKIKW